MALVHVDSSDVDIDVEDGETLIAAAWRLGYWWPTSCGGVGTCFKCWTRVESGAENLSDVEEFERRGIEQIIDDVVHEGKPIRLACQVRVTGDVRVRKTGVRPFSNARRGV